MHQDLNVKHWELWKWRLNWNTDLWHWLRLRQLNWTCVSCNCTSCSVQFSGVDLFRFTQYTCTVPTIWVHRIFMLINFRKTQGGCRLNFAPKQFWFWDTIKCKYIKVDSSTSYHYLLPCLGLVLCFMYSHNIPSL